MCFPDLEKYLGEILKKYGCIQKLTNKEMGEKERNSCVSCYQKQRVINLGNILCCLTSYVMVNYCSRTRLVIFVFLNGPVFFSLWLDRQPKYETWIVPGPMSDIKAIKAVFSHLREKPGIYIVGKGKHS